MLRGIVIAFNFILLLIAEVFQGGGITVNIQAPQEVVAGEEFTINVQINKGDLATFSRLQQSIPAGLKATPVETSNSNFSFEDNKVRNIWLKMPDENTVTLSYKLVADERLKGNFIIDGKFSYIDNNERRSIDVQGPQIVISPSANIEPSQLIDIADYEKTMFPQGQLSPNELQIACLRQQPVYDKAKDEYLVEILVSKERKERFAKIEEKIPSGYRAEVIDDHEAIFTFKNNEAKFLWMNLPSSSFFTVSYKLIPAANMKKGPEINGQFSYLEEEKTRSINIVQTNESVADIGSKEELLALINKMSEIQLGETPDDLIASTNNGPKTTYRTPVVDKNNNAAINTTNKNNIENTANTDNNAGTQPDKPKTKPITDKITQISNKKNQLEADNGVYYRVQIAAGHDEVNTKRYFKKYNFEQQVKIESHGGWFKYSLGPFPIYKEARDYRIFIWNTTDIDDAFVAAYNSGNRITVQEALMIANHKWYR